MGLHRAGFEVVGWDIKQGLSYPFKRHIGNALDADLRGFDFVWASPPCQAHSALRHCRRQKREYECFIERSREKLIAWGGPYIIENVPGAPLINPVQLCGSSFALRVRRHRIFESNLKLVGSICRHTEQGQPMDVSGTGGQRVNRQRDDHGGGCCKPHNIFEARAAIGIDWMVRSEIAQAIPPAYSEFLGRQVMAILTSAQSSAQARQAEVWPGPAAAGCWFAPCPPAVWSMSGCFLHPRQAASGSLWTGLQRTCS
jgi:DNA (cytosine-5)-methyltransferase 1